FSQVAHEYIISLTANYNEENRKKRKKMEGEIPLLRLHFESRHNPMQLFRRESVKLHKRRRQFLYN
ncbi:MAG: hypothetical protein QG610_1173, partial [Euryarchaeota archaeon]|nr:hypothetical protein [Euryarchaeota archaeon]